RGDRKTSHAAKTTKAKSVKKPPAKPAHKAATHAAQRPAAKKAGRTGAAKGKPSAAKASRAAAVKKPFRPAAAKKAGKPQAPRSVTKSRAPAKAAPRKAAAAAAQPEHSASVVAHGGGKFHGEKQPSAPRKRVHQRPASGVAARLSVGGGNGDEQTITREDGRYALPATVNIDLPKGYRPGAKEEYMSPKQLAYFRQKLKEWRDQLVEESRQTMENLREEVRDVGDDAERATRETENSLELRTRDRYRKLISKIEKALRKIEEGRYGYCEETDEEIGLDRLEARPIATLSLDAQERREHLQKQMGD
ncbi:MAG: RNA polymerase-binding protein DksA, partial [Rhodanobacteraceae bacterium]